MIMSNVLDAHPQSLIHAPHEGGDSILPGVGVVALGHSVKHFLGVGHEPVQQGDLFLIVREHTQGGLIAPCNHTVDARWGVFSQREQATHIGFLQKKGGEGGVVVLLG